MRLSTRELTKIAILTSILSILSMISFQVSLIPITLSLFGLFLICVITNQKLGLYVVIIYIMLGILGLPVFSGFKGGLNVIFSPTGGYIISYIPISFIMGKASENIKGFNFKNILYLFLVSIICLTICYILGTFQYCIIGNIAFLKAIKICVAPFVGIDIIKSIIAILTGLKIKSRINIL